MRKSGALHGVNRRAAARWLPVLGVWLAAVPASAGPPSFTRQTIDGTMAGDCKMAGDIDGDGFADVAIAGSPGGEPLTWYRFPDWQKTVIAQAQREWSNYGVLADIDLDDDLDIVLPDGIGPTVHWFENPGGSLASTGPNWTKRTVGNTPDWCKDVFVADYDGDGRPDVAARPLNRQPRLFFREPGGGWATADLSGLEVGSEGLWSADVDGDGDEDLVTRGQVARNPGGAAARVPARWSAVTLGGAPADFKAFVADLDGDGRRDVLFSSSEGVDDVVWFQQPAAGPAEAWQRRTILTGADAAHTLWAADVDADGDQDVVVGAMHAAKVLVMENGGAGLQWTRHVVDAAAAIHNGQVVDLGNDGDPDLFGAGFTGQPTKATVWINQLNPVLGLGEWTYQELTNQHQRAFGLAFADLDRDGLADLASGGAWFRNPGGDLAGPWARTPLPDGMNAVLAVNVDNDGVPDLMATRDEGGTAWYWLEPADAAATTFTQVRVGVLAAASHALGAQGQRYLQVVPGGKPEILTTAGDGAWYFTIPTANPAAGNWPAVHISGRPSDEGLDAGDIDRDGLPDVVATTGAGRQVEWYRNPGTGAGQWQAYQLGGVPEFEYPDRCRVADLNGDGRLDVVVTEENGAAAGAATFWWEQPAAGATGPWPRHLLVEQGSTHSLDVADMDRDGDPDILLGEHRGALKAAVWENDGAGGFTERVIGTGRESHLGMQAADLDGDGDRDLVSIAWDAPGVIHLWRNDAARAGGGPDTAPPILLEASAAGPNEVVARFSEPLAAASVINPEHFVIAGLFIGTAALDPDGRTVRLRTSTLARGATYVLAVTGVEDLADPPNTVPAGTSAAFTGPADPAAGIAHHWPCDEGAGPTAADAAGGWHATLAGAGWDAAGRAGAALTFDGTSRADLGTGSLAGPACTIALWFKATQLVNGVDARFISKASSTAEQGHFWLLGLAESGGVHRLRARLRAGGATSTLIAAGTSIATGRWYHAALVYDGAAIKLYLDSSEVGTLAKAGALDTSDQVPAALGGQPDGSNGFRGLLDDVRLWQRPLSAAEVGTLMNPQPGAAESYAGWAHGLAAAAPDDDCDGDRVVNLLEFLFGGNPAAPDAGTISPRAWSSTDGRRIGCLFRDARGLLPVRAEGSADLLGWVPMAALPGFEDAAGGSDGGVPLRRVSIDRPPAPAWFVRLRAGL